MGRESPDDFAETLIRIGRLACQTHYAVGRSTIDRWLEEHGKRSLIEQRAANAARNSGWLGEAERARVRAQFIAEMEKSQTIGKAARTAGISTQTVYKWRNSDPDFAAAWDKALAERKLTRSDMARILSAAFPVRHENPTAHQAAQFLRQVRNGGWPVSQSPCGKWWVGTSLRTEDELIAFAQRKGFTPSLTGDANTKVG